MKVWGASFINFFKEVGIFLAILWFLSTISFFPSYQLTKTIKQTITLELPERIKPGDPITFQKQKKFRSVYLNSSPLSLLNNKTYLGVPDVSAEGFSIIHGVINITNNYFTPLKFPELHYFTYDISLEELNKKKAANLRLPANVWKRVNDKHKEQKDKERAIMKALLKKNSGPLSLKCWNLPLKSKIVSRFGSPRRLPSGKSYNHTGVDLRASIGTPIKASGPGKVVWAEHMILPGNLVVIDHGGGLYSRYMHLSEIKVKPNQKVKTGDLIGLAGATGRVEASHLHWEVVWKGNRANPFEFINTWKNLCDQG